MSWRVHPRLCSSLWIWVDFMCEMSIFFIFFANMEQTQKNSAKSVILPHKHRINNVPGKKVSFSQHTVGLFPWAHCKPTNADIGGPPMWHKHIWRSVRKEEKSKPKSQRKERKIHAVFLQVTMHLSCLSDGAVSFWFQKLIDFFLDLVQLQGTSIKNRCFIIMGHTVEMNVSLITSFKTRIVNVKVFLKLLIGVSLAHWNKVKEQLSKHSLATATRHSRCLI